MIPKVIVQTSRNKPAQYIINMIDELSPGWEYQHYNDSEVINFFLKNPLSEFPDIVNKFFSFSYGETSS